MGGHAVRCCTYWRRAGDYTPAASYTGLIDQQRRDAEEVYGLIAGLIQDDGTVSKEELVKAHGGNYAAFDVLDTNQNGTIELDEWLAFCQASHKDKCADPPIIEVGDMWLDEFFFTLRRGCGLKGLTDRQIQYAEDTYALIADLIDKDGVATKEEILKAQGGGAYPNLGPAPYAAASPRFQVI
jgi:hypothetical protein